MKVKTILVSQPAPKAENSPYLELSEKQKESVGVLETSNQPLCSRARYHCVVALFEIWMR